MANPQLTHSEREHTLKNLIKLRKEVSNEVGKRVWLWTSVEIKALEKVIVTLSDCV